MKQLQNIGFYLLELCVKIAIILLIFSAIRILFYLHNQAHFPIQYFSDGFPLFVHALRFDLSAICYVNLLLIISYLIPLPQRRHKQYLTVQHWLFVTFNGFAFLFELTDVAYFPFSQKRINTGDFDLLSNTNNLLPLFLKEYWYLLIFFVIILFFLSWSFRKWGLTYPPPKQHFIGQFFIFLIGAGLTVLGLRGGTQLRPLMPLSAQQYVSNLQLAPLVYPTTLGLLFSSQQRFLKEKQYFDKSQLDQISPIHHQDTSSSGFNPKQNIVVIILESFGQEYSGLFNNEKGYTVFLDSITQEGFYYEHSFANGLRSTQGIAAISASIPALMEDPYIFSAYQANQLDGIASLLKKEDYTSGFFHGANPGSMGFENFAHLCGFDYYFDRRNYKNDADYDGHWGIWDRPFFQYTAQILDTFPEPFYAQLFSLSSHHPYIVEPFYEQLQPKSMPMYRSIRYTDFALRQFFQTASQMPWFDNTLFIITADHTGFSRVYKYKSRIGRYQIPILIYKPNSKLKGRQKGVAQQIDILPTVLDFIDFTAPYTSFGNSMLDTTSQRYAYMYLNQLYQILDERFILLFDEEKTLGLYDYIQDPGMKKNIMDQFQEDRKRLERQLKAVIQQHHNGLINNELGASVRGAVGR